MKMDVMEADHLGHIPASFLHSSLQRQLHALPGLSNGGPVNRYAFGISFVYEKGYVQSIVSNWPGFRLKFTEDFTTLGFHGGRPPKDNIYRTSKHTIFVYWLNKEPKALLAMYKIRRAFLSATCNAPASIQDRKANLANSCGILRMYIHRIFALENKPLPGEGLTWLPEDYKFNYQESDVMLFDFHTASAPVSTGLKTSSRLHGRNEYQHVYEDVAEAPSSLRKRRYALSGSSTQDHEEGNQIKRARNVVTASSARDTDANSTGEGHEDYEHTYMESEDIKVRIIDRTEASIVDSNVQQPKRRFSASLPRNPDVEAQPPSQAQLEHGNAHASNPLRALDHFFTNMETVRAEFTALKSENARLKEELQGERERRERAERALGRVRKAVTGTTS